MRFFIISFLLIATTSLLYAQSDGSTGEIIPGASKPKSQKTKKAKIKYAFHNGTMNLKTGLVLRGDFKYIESKLGIPQFQVIEAGNKKSKKKVSLSMVQRLKVAGAEKGITAYNDSTEFVWIDQYKDLYRKVRAGVVEVYDNSRIVNEEYPFLADYLLITGRQDYGYKAIREVKDLELVMSDRPYFLQSAKFSGRYESKDFRVVLYLIDLFNDDNPMKKLKWDDMTLTLKDGTRVQGKGYFQPMDVRGEYISTSNNAFIHFYDGKDFHLYNQRDISAVLANGIPYEAALYTSNSKYFYGRAWTNNGTEYIVTKRIIHANNYYFRTSSNNFSDLVILKKVGESYIKPANELELRKVYAEQMKKQRPDTEG
ncbi:MAG: hypothetical protein R3E32_07955 [Chitinophagales bacterium]